MEIEEEKAEQKHLIPFEIKQQIVFDKTQGTLNKKEKQRKFSRTLDAKLEIQLLKEFGKIMR